jgi:hypothetical protein
MCSAASSTSTSALPDTGAPLLTPYGWMHAAGPSGYLGDISTVMAARAADVRFSRCPQHLVILHSGRWRIGSFFRPRQPTALLSMDERALAQRSTLTVRVHPSGRLNLARILTR